MIWSLKYFLRNYEYVWFCLYPGEFGFYGVLMHEAKFCKGEIIGFYVKKTEGHNIFLHILLQNKLLILTQYAKFSVFIEIW